MAKKLFAVLEDLKIEDSAVYGDTPYGEGIDDAIEDASTELNERIIDIDDLNDQVDEADNAVDTINAVGDILEQSENPSTEALKVAQICVERLCAKLDMKDSKISLEGYNKNTALESISETAKKIIDAIKKALAFMWQKLKDFFNFIRTKVIGLFKNKQKAAEIKIKTYEKDVNEKEVFSFKDFAIYNAFYDGSADSYRKTPTSFTIRDQMHNLLKDFQKAIILKGKYETYVRELTEISKDINSYSKNQLKTKCSDIFKRIFAFSEFGDTLHFNSIPYQSKIVEHEDGTIKLKGVFSNPIDKRGEIVWSGNPDTLNTIVNTCSDLNEELNKIPGNIDSIQKSSSSFINSINRILDNIDNSEVIDKYRLLLREFEKTTKFVLTLNKDMAGLVIKSVQQAYRYIDLSVKGYIDSTKE